MDETYRFIKNSELNYLMYTLTTISIKDTKMHLKTLSFGLAVALASTVTLAAPVDYKLIQRTQLLFFHGITLVFQHQALTSQIFKV